MSGRIKTEKQGEKVLTRSVWWRISDRRETNSTSLEPSGRTSRMQYYVFHWHMNTGTCTCPDESCHLQKYSDDSAVVGCSSDGQEAEHRELVDHFTAWCGNNRLIFNTNKTTEMTEEFWRTRNKPNTVSILRGGGWGIQIPAVHLDNGTGNTAQRLSSTKDITDCSAWGS